MPRLIVLYPVPQDAQDFEKTYREEHVPLVRAQLGSARLVTASRIAPLNAAIAPYHWMTELQFTSMEQLTQAIASDGGLRAIAHARQISSGGPPIMFAVEDDASGGQPA